MTKKIKINRAPVMTLWATVVAERMGYDKEEALTLGKSVAGLNAQSKGKRLGIYEESKDDGDESKSEKKTKKKDEPLTVDLMGRSIPATKTKEGIRATNKDVPIKPESVQSYLEKKFGEELKDVRAAMETLAKAYSPEKLADKAYDLYEDFRPKIPEGKKGWGAAGELDLERIRSLAG